MSKIWRSWKCQRQVWMSILKSSPPAADKWGRWSLKTCPPVAVQEVCCSAAELIVQVDGGHIPITPSSRKRESFLSPLSTVCIGLRRIFGECLHHHKIIIDKNFCVVSWGWQSTNQIQRLIIVYKKIRGMSLETKVAGWQMALIIAGLCIQCRNPVLALNIILDWFHIGKEFQNVKNAPLGTWALRNALDDSTQMKL